MIVDRGNNRFIFELPLCTTSADEAAMETRMQAYRHVYNACLGEALRRLDLCRESKEFQAARKLPRGEKGNKEQKARSKAFRKVMERFKFNEYDLHLFATKIKNSCWIKDHLGAHEPQSAATRAFGAVKQCAFGKRGRPRFKSFRRCRSVEGKSNATGLRWRADHVEWNGLIIPAIFDKQDKDGYQQQALACETKLCRLVRRVEKGGHRYFIQLVQVGLPPKKAKNTIGKERVGIDVGPSTVAVVGDTKAGLFQLAPSVDHPWQQIRRIQRAMDRSRRMTNPQNYDERGGIKQGVNKWVRSKHYLNLLVELREAERVLASGRKRDHGKLQNDILRVGLPQRENVSHLSWQKMFGRSAKVRASGEFESGLYRKAENAGAQNQKFEPRSTKLSQTCLCGETRKKSLSERQHVCSCGINAQRDLFSAFLAKYVVRDIHKDRLDIPSARQAWEAGADTLLELAVSSLNKLVSLEPIGESTSKDVRMSRKLNPLKNQREVKDVVPSLELVRALKSVGCHRAPSLFYCTLMT